MGVEYEIVWGGDGPEDVLVTTSGEATVEGLNDYIQAVVGDSRFHESIRALVDHRSLSWSSMSRDDIHRRVDDLTRDPQGARSRVAVVLGRAVDYGLVRMELAYAADRWNCDVRAFYSMEEAREWLAEKTG